MQLQDRFTFQIKLEEQLEPDTNDHSKDEIQSSQASCAKGRTEMVLA